MFQKDLRPNTATIAAATSAGTSNVGYLPCRAASFGALRATWIGPLPQLRGVGRDAGGQAFAHDGAQFIGEIKTRRRGEGNIPLE